MPVFARYRSNTMYRNIHYFSVGGSVGYSTLLENIPDLNTWGSVGGALSFGYELRCQGFWLNTGGELQYTNSFSTFNISGCDRMVYDTQGKQTLFHYNFNQSLDNQRFAYANIPLMLGYYYIGFYVGAGAKIGYCLSALESTSLNYTISATYNQYIDDFAEMEDHYYSTYNIRTTEALNARWKFSLIGEIGYDVLAWARQANRTEHHGLKIGGYVEYGLNNIINTSSERPLYTIDAQNASTINVVPYYNANSAQAHRIVPLYAGIRISWIFCVKTRHCDCNVRENHRAYYKRYNNIQH